MNMFSQDIRKYKKYSGNKSAITLIITNQGLWALFVYRASNSIYKSKLPRIIKRILLVFAVICQKWIEIITGISLPYTSRIGAGFYIGHFGGIIINASAVIGVNCNISQGVTIGVSGREEKRGVPIIGNNVYIGTNAVIAGKINIGDNCVIGANSLVINSVEANKTVLGVPAVVINNNTSKDYI
ncbi:serine O-acetyltransferase [Flavivirga spongiicola]|uniref:Serine acetyltransferase n=1 Tax=Flavivirga spongiicola TaxID=421621 RepID=A0ABU7XQ35_9FLAO|nr:DapH/DapD/GlmU-related protein [Flavivirga sp. MEBiC05379]MDO5981678.1 DapH/DapD/GlmU-related protein [Flavivirga sp. MEBiC05379]